MKRFKNFNVFDLVFGLSLLFIVTSCSKSSIEPNNGKDMLLTTKSKSFEVPNIKSIESIPRTGDLWDLFISKEGNNISNSEMDKAKVYRITFEGLESLVGLHIELASKGDTSKDLFFVIDLVTKTHLTLLRDKVGFIDDNKGLIIFRTNTGRVMHENYFENNKIVKKNLIDIRKKTNSNIKSLVASLDGIEAIKWSCTQTQFDNYYKEAKKRCEDDTLCDVVCSFNPCAIAYLAYAVGACTGVIEN
jgi:hypothetical protein